MSFPPPPMPDRVFLLNVKNRAFVDGQTSIPADENPAYVLIAKLAGAALGVSIAGYWIVRAFTEGNPFTLGWQSLYLVLLPAFIVFVLYSTLAPIVRNRRFLRACRLVYGELTHCERVDDDGTIDWRTRYRFLSPSSGQMLEGKWTTEGTVTRVSDRPDPSPGVRVAIAYIDDKTHRML
jgi:hypothetical protein